MSDTRLVKNTIELKFITQGQNLSSQPKYVTQSQISVLEIRLVAKMTLLQNQA